MTTPKDDPEKYFATGLNQAFAPVPYLSSRRPIPIRENERVERIMPLRQDRCSNRLQLF